MSFTRFQTASLMAALASTLWLAGCSANFGTVTATGGPIATNSGATTLGGTVFGGQQPVNGSTVQLWVAGTNGYGSAATKLGSAVTTNSNGGFSLGSYTCPSGAYVYVTAAGGDPQIGTGSTANPAIALMAALGPCSSLSSSTFININEVTTVAAVWALAPFSNAAYGTALINSGSTPSDTFGTTSTNTQGIANAMAVAGVLANTATGVSPGANTSATSLNVEYWQINTLADILALCVNSTGTASATCAPVLSSLASSIGGTAPADTLQIAMLLAKNPTKSTGLLSQITGTPPFLPYDTTVNDWTIGYSVPTGGSATRFIALDQFGNAWVAANTGVTELDPTGNLISNTTSYTLNSASKSFLVAYQVAVDTANNAWVTDQTGGSVVEFVGSTSAGGANGGASIAVATGSTSTEGIAIDSQNNIWYSTSSGHIFELPHTGYTTPVSGVATTSLPYGVAVDLSNNPASPNYTVSNGGSFVYAINSNGCSGESLGGTTSGYGGSIAMAYTVGGPNNSPAVGAGTPVSYIANAICNTTSKVAANGAYNFMSTPTGVAVDSSNNLWIINQNYVTSDTSGPHYSITKATQNYGTTFTAAGINSELSFVNVNGGGLSTPWFIAMDGDSQAWVGNSYAASGGVSQGTVSAFKNDGTALSPSTGLYGGVYTSGGVTYKRAIVAARGVAVDGSGNVWIANSSTFTFPGTTSAVPFVTVLTGAATPTVTPLARGIANYTLASKP